jgi:beta-glucosidase
MKSGGFPIQPDFGAVYPFGHGLTYTSFEYSGFAVERAEVPVDGTIRVSCTVTNTGKRAGDEVVQLYVRDRLASFVRPVKELKGFRRVSLGIGESAAIEFSLPVDMLAFTVEGVDRAVEPGEFEIMLGASSEDIRFRDTVTVRGEVRKLPENWRMHCDTRVTRK